MDDQDAALLAILATLYAAKMRRANRPEWLVLAFLLLVRAMRRELVSSASTAFLGGYSAGMTAAIGNLAAQLVRYVGLMIPSAEPIPPLPVAMELRHAIAQAVAKAQSQLSGKPLARRLALIVQAETQLATARLAKQAAQHPAVRGIERATHSGNPCPTCDALAGTYYPPYPVELFYTHPRCACSWTEIS